MRYFLVLIGLSSIIVGQKPCGFALMLAFLITVIFAILLFSYTALAAVCASDMSADSKLGL
jgi:hypothetical protein